MHGSSNSDRQDLSNLVSTPTVEIMLCEGTCKFYTLLPQNDSYRGGTSREFPSKTGSDQTASVHDIGKPQVVVNVAWLRKRALVAGLHSSIHDPCGNITVSERYLRYTPSLFFP